MSGPAGATNCDRPVFRFAPSPNGLLHLGHALSALTVYEMSRRFGGRFLLRIEDIDVTRSRPEFETAIYRDLDWLGIRWEEPVLRQSEHSARYQEAIAPLAEAGLLYKCFASRAEITAAADPAQLDPDGALVYPGLWRDRELDAKALAEAAAHDPRFALRLDMGKAISRVTEILGSRPLTFSELDGNAHAARVHCVPARWGDVIVVRKEFPASYLLSVVVDDAFQGVTHVTRGRDLYAATDAQRLLQVLLGLPEPFYHHHRLVLDENGRKLSKSAGSTSLESLRASGVTVLDMKKQLGLN